MRRRCTAAPSASSAICSRSAARGSGGELFAATKVWTPFDRTGAEQVAQSLRLWRLQRLDLVHVHNLLNWRAHLKTLRVLKDEGRVRSIGITTSHGRRHDEMLDIIRREPLDAIQITYSLADESAEPVLAAAAERGMAVIVNRPFDGGSLVDRANRAPLPSWAREELDCTHWSELLLKWIVSHPAVSCAIPATSDPAHMAQNMAAARGRMPDATQRRRIAGDAAPIVVTIMEIIRACCACSSASATPAPNTKTPATTPASGGSTPWRAS